VWPLSRSLHEQCSGRGKKLGYVKPGQKTLSHVQFGMMSLPEGEMSQEGRVVLLEHVISEVVDLAGETIMIKNPELKARKKVAQEVGSEP